jgi:predicted nucleotidyltransferase
MGLQIMVVSVIQTSISVREGDFIETTEGLIFDVKGLVHPPDKAIAFLRYYPAPKGKRARDGQKYDKVYHLANRFDFLRQHYPHYIYHDEVFGRELQGIPHSFVNHVYQPQVSLAKLMQLDERDPLQQDVVTFSQLIEQAARIPQESLGISGSVQVDLHGPTSDIDLIVYGRREARAVQLALKRSSGTGIPIETMLLVDGLKSMHGIFGGHHYFVRAVLNWDQVQRQYGDYTFHPLGQARVRCTITKDRDGLFTPCRYEIDDVKFLKGKAVDDVREVVSFRGRFTEQVRQDEEVIVQGSLEAVQQGKDQWVRFVLGDQPTDILLPSSLL